ncbi:MAG TPA: hypothetical protein VIG49_12840 [Acetobacteraceae bacterium]
MAKTRGNGLLMAWTDVDAAQEAAFNQWYDDEHIPRLTAVPGFISGSRYRALRGGPKYLAMYELEDHNVLRSAAFLDTIRYLPSPRRTQVSPSSIGRNFLLNGYRQIFPVKTHPADNTMEPAPFLQIGRIDIAASMEEEFNDWYNTAYIPEYLKVPGCLRARRFVAVEGLPKYLTVYEFANAGVPDTAAWAAARVGNPWNQRMRPHVRLDEGSPAVFERILPA